MQFDAIQSNLQAKKQTKIYYESYITVTAFTVHHDN